MFFLYQDIHRNCIGRKVKSKDLNSINTFISRMQDDQLTKGHYCLSMKKIVVIYIRTIEECLSCNLLIVKTDGLEFLTLKEMLPR